MPMWTCLEAINLQYLLNRSMVELEVMVFLGPEEMLRMRPSAAKLPDLRSTWCVAPIPELAAPMEPHSPVFTICSESASPFDTMPLMNSTPLSVVSNGHHTELRFFVFTCAIKLRRTFLSSCLRTWLTAFE